MKLVSKLHTDDPSLPHNTTPSIYFQPNRCSFILSGRETFGPSSRSEGKFPSPQADALREAWTRCPLAAHARFICYAFESRPFLHWVENLFTFEVDTVGACKTVLAGSLLSLLSKGGESTVAPKENEARESSDG